MDVKGFLIDLDGVLYVGDRAIDGAKETIALLRERGYRFRFVSNTTRKCRKTIVERLSGMGFDIAEREIFTPPMAAIAHMNDTNKHRFYLLTTGDVHKDFPTSPASEAGEMDYVIIGDAGERLTYGNMNRAFRYLMNGAELLALEKDRYWMEKDGLSLSAGPFVAGLEFATGKRATVMGKPSPSFFNLALRDMNLSPVETAMIGDDLMTDISGSQEIGMTGMLVRTGKFRADTLKTSPVKPMYIIDSIAEVAKTL